MHCIFIYAQGNQASAQRTMEETQGKGCRQAESYKSAASAAADTKVQIGIQRSAERHRPAWMRATESHSPLWSPTRVVPRVVCRSLLRQLQPCLTLCSRAISMLCSSIAAFIRLTPHTVDVHRCSSDNAVLLLPSAISHHLRFAYDAEVGQTSWSVQYSVTAGR